MSAFRRYFAWLLADHREKLPTIQTLLGHAAVSTTDRYVHRLQDDTRAAVNKISLGEKGANDQGEGRHVAKWANYWQSQRESTPCLRRERAIS